MWDPPPLVSASDTEPGAAVVTEREALPSAVIPGGQAGDLRCLRVQMHWA
jgi:hypothetical protein